METITTKLIIHSPVFGHNGHIPFQYTCEGENYNPPIEVEDMPPGTKTLAVIMEDPDAPKGTFDHWIVWNLPPNEAIFERSNQGMNGTNSFGNTGYGGPCPPSGTHRYYFRIFALDTELTLPAGAGKQDLKDAMDGHILAKGEIMGRYKKRNLAKNSGATG
ncbi:MAG: YbhB/YbcL family Raf kinase inhibitor-like protein [Chitinophagaceae bacterium]|nr:YbhB/YbcL family Raf kinase inhibitor-like protein [Chitinophagaceae bacterium]